MAFELFPFPNFSSSGEFPEEGFRIHFGDSYVYTAPSGGPSQRTFTVKFKTMRMVLFPNGQIDSGSDPENNFGALYEFYLRHKLHKSFVFPHPFFGDMVVKFHKPLQIPEGIKDGNGWTNPFQIDLVEIPGQTPDGSGTLTEVVYVEMD